MAGRVENTKLATHRAAVALLPRGHAHTTPKSKSKTMRRLYGDLVSEKGPDAPQTDVPGLVARRQDPPDCTIDDDVGLYATGQLGGHTLDVQRCTTFMLDSNPLAVRGRMQVAGGRWQGGHPLRDGKHQWIHQRRYCSP